tara:strand:+ start:1680 stop:2012 length:333 start_codon:yes stop_codon:yes gene_type:complete
MIVREIFGLWIRVCTTRHQQLSWWDPDKLTESQIVTFIKILHHVPEPNSFCEEDIFLSNVLCLVYDDFRILIENFGDAYLAPKEGTKPHKIYNSFKSEIDLAPLYFVNYL